MAIATISVASLCAFPVLSDLIEKDNQYSIIRVGAGLLLGYYLIRLSIDFILILLSFKFDSYVKIFVEIISKGKVPSSRTWAARSYGIFLQILYVLILLIVIKIIEV